MLIALLDEELPALAGCEINDDPLAPICQACRQLVAKEGEAAGVVWVARDRRYGEKLATPDITIADLIGEVDPIKVAEGRYLSDELTIHYGLLPRTHRGIFAINELPDLAERIQVGLLNIMEERDVQIRGYKVRLPLDLYVVASANPEDYTNRGRIITPLKDRFGSQVRTHYPKKLADEITIMEAERTSFPVDGIRSITPEYMKQVVAELTHLARASSDISQRSGVSVRVSIANYENLLSSALKRAIRLDEGVAVPRVSDLGALAPSTGGKIEMETAGEGGEEKILDSPRAEGGAERLQPVVRRRGAGGGGEGLRGRCRRADGRQHAVRGVHQAGGPDAGAAGGRRQARRHRAGRHRRRGGVRARGAAPTKKLNKDVQAGRYRYRV